MPALANPVVTFSTGAHDSIRSPSVNCGESVDVSAASNAAAIGEEENTLEERARYNQRRSLEAARKNAGEWFADSNQNVSANRNVNFVDGKDPRAARNNNDLDLRFATDDPPFYLSRKSSSEDEATRSKQRVLARRGGSTIQRLRQQPTLSYERSYGSSSEEFRGVIDDLTVENKKLRQRLRRYERIHVPYLEGDRLLEVRIHGVPAAKRRKLEQTLREFASSLGDTGTQTSPEESLQTGTQSFPALPSGRRKPGSSATSSLRFQDSGYASISTSNNNKPAAALGVQQEVEKRSAPTKSNDQTVKSYLRDIPEGLFPKQSPIMTEKAKKKLVVKRLEQLFTGKGLNFAQHNQSQQQQEIANIAASADRRATELSGHKSVAEGKREANILPMDAELQQPEVREFPTPLLRTEKSDDSQNCTGDPVSDQRPTRPLDLDPYRTQNPEDNIQYIRHLGMASPNMNTPGKSDKKSSAQTDDWVYLNLLIGMAQLHTINVTPDFVRRAIAEVSAKFEVSPDGKKLRWRGGREGTRMSSDGGSSAESSNDASGESAELKTAPCKDRPAATMTGITRSSYGDSSAELGAGAAAGRRPIFLGQVGHEKRLAYDPIFFHADGSEAEHDFYLNDYDSLESISSLENSGEMAGRSNRRNASASMAQSRQSGEDGRIIFYRKARFCTDLSGDREGVPYSVSTYSRSTKDVIGREKIRKLDTIAGSEGKGPLDNEDFEIQSDASEDDGSMKEFGISPAAQEKHNVQIVEPIDLEASGVGGVQPSDNFSIDVLVRHVSLEDRSHSRTLSPFSAPKRKVRRVMHNIPETSLNAFRGRKRSIDQTDMVQNEILSIKQTLLPPSRLPPPSYVQLVSSSSGTSDEDSAQELKMGNPLTMDPNLDQFIVGSKFLKTFSTHSVPASPSTDNESNSGEDSDDDSSIDMLATARQENPDLVAAREREFDRCARDDALEISDNSAITSGDSGNVEDMDEDEDGSDEEDSDED
jgi:hypothetical protein